MQARRDLLGEDASDDEAPVLDGALVRALLQGQEADGGFGIHAYGKWTGAHWRLVSLVELGIPAGVPRAVAAYETVLRWLVGAGHRRGVPRIDERNEPGLADDPRVVTLAESLVEWQWPAGGWNCDRRPHVTHPSFHETISPLWGLAEYAAATGDSDARAAAGRASNLFLDHRVFRSHTTGEIGDGRWLDLHWPPYWAYDMARGLTILGRAGALPDGRADDALRLLRDKQADDGRWSVDRRWPNFSTRDPVAWPARGPSEMLTRNALRALRAGDA